MNDKVSRYNIAVEYDDGVLLYNTLSNKILPISAKDYAVIETLMENLLTFQSRFPNLYVAFRHSGFIVDSDFDELAYLKLQNKRCIFMNRDYHLTINPTLDCNLKCWYCSLEYAGAKFNRERMSDEVVDSLNKHIALLMTQQKADSVLLDWFGGEPLIYFDEVVKKVSDYALSVAAKSKVKIKQQITTNATLLNKDRIYYMKDANFDFFQISMDGNERRQNLIKHYSDKRGTYSDVVNNINLLTEINPAISICLRINYDKQTLKNVKEIINDFSGKTKKCIMVSFQKVWQIPFTAEMSELLIETKKIFEMAGIRSSYWKYKPFQFRCCYADNYNYYVVNYDGRIFKCSARDYSEELVIGNLQTSGEVNWNHGILSKMFLKATFENECCENCQALPLCMGPCIQKNYDALVNKKRLSCMYDSVEHSLSSYVIEMAKQRNLI
ncbi:radical SAM/SPASM domain-containing protein [Bacteroides hominis]|uniref:SPASM domain-containing protein n=1 Tax=Bacteroides fragilis TaxID=817 RepID=A0AAP8ZS13_BACFG|nr:MULTISPECIES: radical SAM protein [Bacteroides]MBV4155414.1 SPASM domain-containing protein [Bacteroides fragilis]MCE8579795.1 SPASM domain-containing protein [Bacteroides fragilis]MCE8648229.1 SPASM domain-containing protein [Bacteroides fragilis]MCM0220844.1 SPASM domain-containing protein [Bacteroides fragilis]MCM0268759.1 SPASM domain-containing protein [Bacteroides fragilis]